HRCPYHAALAREAFAGGEIGVVLIGQAAHEPPARPRDLGWIERKILILCELQRDRFDFAQPGGATEFAAAPTHAPEQRCFVPNAYLPQLYARPESAGEVAHELPEIDPSLGSKEERQLVAIPLPLCLGHLH